MREPVQSLWIGPELSTMERVSIASFLGCGHPFHLYTYDEVRGIPPGVDVRDANEILPASMIFQYTEHKSYAGFANYFRYKLLLDKGGWWSDCDSVCVRPLEFETPFVFSSERHEGVVYVNNGNIHAPAGSEFFSRAWEVCRGKDPAQLKWGEVGPRLVAALVKELGLETSVQAPEVFCPFGYEEWELLLAEDPPAIPEEARAVHLWNEMWRRGGRDKNGSYAPTCLYERFKAQYLDS